MSRYFIMVYSIDEYNLFASQNNYRIFGNKFVSKNKGKCKIVYKNKVYQLTEYLNDIVKSFYRKTKFNLYRSHRLTKLKVIYYITNFYGMFMGCNQLLLIKDNTKLKVEKEIINSFKNPNLNNTPQKSKIKINNILYIFKKKLHHLYHH